MNCSNGQACKIKCGNYTKFETLSDKEPEHTFCWGLCCFQGCVLGAIGMAYFFLILPTGILLLFHGINKNTAVTLALGIVVLCVPTFVVLPTLLFVRWKRHKLKDQKAEEQVKRQGYENPVSMDDEL